jgi:Fe-Mn family superoxide dismutase
MYNTKPLPFSEDLEGISKKTIEQHHDKLYVGYVNKSNEIREKLVVLRESGNFEGNATFSELRALKDAETFAVNGVYLHEWYFDLLGGNGDWQKAPNLVKLIEEKWGSMEKGIAYFSACAMAARGWSILAWDMKYGKIKHYNSDIHNQAVWGCVPLITLDVYEHAYFMDYGTDKKGYIQAFWKNMNWEAAEMLLNKVSGITL